MLRTRPVRPAVRCCSDTRNLDRRADRGRPARPGFTQMVRHGTWRHRRLGGRERPAVGPRDHWCPAGRGDPGVDRLPAGLPGRRGGHGDRTVAGRVRMADRPRGCAPGRVGCQRIADCAGSLRQGRCACCRAHPCVHAFLDSPGARRPGTHHGSAAIGRRSIFLGFAGHCRGVDPELSG